MFFTDKKRKVLKSHDLKTFLLVETSGLEPLTPCMSSKYSNQLSYASKYLQRYYTLLYTLCQDKI